MRLFTFLLLIFIIAIPAKTAEKEKHWLFFVDKGPGLHKAALYELEGQLSQRVKWRRSKVIKSGAPLVDQTDLPVYRPYIEDIKSRHIEIIVVSKWLNAVSVSITLDQAAQLASLPFVDVVQKVGRGRKRPVIEQPENLFKPRIEGTAGEFDYGPSFEQNAQIRIPDVHGAGVTGRGVLVAVLDTGFNLDNEAFDGLDVVATYDFINDDENVDNEDGDVPPQNSHGTRVLSIIAGYAPGHIIGPAFDSSFLLAKTEDISSETEIEEDFWIAAAEWAEGLGADVITSSLGYSDWYEYSDLNGQTAPITIAADMAVSKGVVVLTSAGNEGDEPWYYILTPADGFEVIAVGAVNSSGTIAGFSSHGPTSDGRIKPEVVAMGVNTFYAYPGSGYGRGNGTSYSCPLVAGVAAMILSAHPELSPKQVRQALIQTADQLTQPDNTYGFGLVDALAAVNYHGTISDPAESNRLVSVYPNPFSYSVHDELLFVLDLKEYTDVRIELYNVLGQSYGAIIQTALPAAKERLVRWNGLVQSGRSVPSGVYYYRAFIGDYQKTGKVTLLQ